MTRLEQTFAKLGEQKKSALITYIMGGDPNAAVSLDIMHALAAGGADIIELGVPFSDPMADGPIIQEAAIRALSNGATVAKTLAQLQAFRQKNQVTPVILMGYYNPIFHYGVAKFCADAKNAGADGFIIVDLPPEEDAELYAETQKHGLAIIRLVAPTTDNARLKIILERASGFVYFVSMAGITGTKNVDVSGVVPSIQNIKKHTKLPVCVGFGIKTAEQAQELGKHADGVVVGSAIVDIIRKTPSNAAVQQFIEELSKGLKQ